jgi:hypothetical protein
VLGVTYIAAGAAHFGVKQGFLDMFPHKGAWGFFNIPGVASAGACGLGSGLRARGCMDQGSGFRVRGFRVQGLGCSGVQGLGFRV